MPTHRLSIELDDLQYEILQNAVTSGHYASESEAVSSLLLDLFHEGDPEAFTSSRRATLCRETRWLRHARKQTSTPNVC